MGSKTLELLTVICFAFFVIGCGGGEEAASDGAEASGGEMSADAPAGTAVISGTVHFEGTPPERQPLDVDRECMENREDPPLSETVVVNENGTLKWVFVHVTGGLGDRTFPVPEEPVVLDQEGCMYQPHVFGVQAGQPIEIRNSDPFQHNIHALPETNRPFNFSQPVQGMTQERVFRAPEVPVQIKCDVHGWMQAWAGVVEHPYHNTTGDDGAFTLENLPAGEYEIEAWHEQYGTQTQTVTVEEDGSATVDFTFTEKAAS